MRLRGRLIRREKRGVRVVIYMGSFRWGLGEVLRWVWGIGRLRR